jgi:hypothetical protein
VVRRSGIGVDPEGSRDPGGEPRFEDESRVLRFGSGNGFRTLIVPREAIKKPTGGGSAGPNGPDPL